MDVGLSELDRIDGLCGGHNRDELRYHLFGWCSSGLPALFPPSRIGPLSVCIPAPWQVRVLWVRHNRNESTQIADQCYLQAELLTWMVRTWQADTSRGHFSDNLAFGVSTQGKKGSHITERVQILILIRAQDRHHCPSFSMQMSQELGAHAFTIHNDPLHLDMLLVVFVAFNDGGQPHHQMLIPPMCGSKQGMSLLIVEQDQSAAAKNRSQAPNQSARNEHIAVNRLAMTIDVARQSALRFGCLVSGMPELPRPMGQSVG